MGTDLWSAAIIASTDFGKAAIGVVSIQCLRAIQAYFNNARSIVHISVPFPYTLFSSPSAKMISTVFLLAATLAAFLGPILPVQAQSPDMLETNDASLSKRAKRRGRHVYFEVELQQEFTEGTSRDLSQDITPVRTAMWISGHRLGGVPLRIDMRLVEYNPGVFVFTPYVQEIDFPFPSMPRPPRGHASVAVLPRAEMYFVGDIWLNNLDIMDFRTGEGCVLDVLTKEPSISSAAMDPNVFMYELLFDLFGSDHEPDVPQLASRIANSRDYYVRKNPSFISLVPLIAYQAGPGGRHRRWFNLQNIEQPVNVAEADVPTSLLSVASMIAPAASNPYIPVWGTVFMQSSARPLEL